MRLQWLPGSQDTWNGIITNYTIEYSILHPVSTEQLDGMFSTSAKTYEPEENNPDPTLATSPLMWEQTEIEELQPYFVYSFSIHYENSAGKSDRSKIFEISLPYTGNSFEISVPCIYNNVK